MIENIDSTIAGVAEYWGDQMPMNVMEECAELIQAISKYKRDETLSNKERIAIEMAGVFIGCYALMNQLDISNERMLTLVSRKLKRRYD